MIEVAVALICSATAVCRPSQSVRSSQSWASLSAQLLIKSEYKTTCYIHVAMLYWPLLMILHSTEIIMNEFVMNERVNEAS